MIVNQTPNLADKPQAHLSLVKLVGHALLNCFLLGPGSALLLVIAIATVEPPTSDWTDVLPFLLLGLFGSGVVCFIASLLVYLPIAWHIRQSSQPFHRRQAFRYYLPVVMGIMLVFATLVLTVSTFNSDSFLLAGAFALIAYTTAIVGLLLFLLSVDRLLQRDILSKDKN